MASARTTIYQRKRGRSMDDQLAEVAESMRRQVELSQQLQAQLLKIIEAMKAIQLRTGPKPLEGTD